MRTKRARKLMRDALVVMSDRALEGLGGCSVVNLRTDWGEYVGLSLVWQHGLAVEVVSVLMEWLVGRREWVWSMVMLRLGEGRDVNAKDLACVRAV